MQTMPLIQTVTLSRQAVDSPEPYDAVQCNIDFVNLLIGEYFKAGELPADSLLSYYVDYYLSQVNNGGFAQFIYNSGLDDEINDWIAQGLQKMGAVRHAALFAQSLKQVREMPEDRLQTFFDSEFFGQNHERDALNESNEAFYALEDEEDLDEINGRWLRSLPNLKIVDEADLEREAARLGALIPDRAARMQAAQAQTEANRPDYERHILALCNKAGQVLDRITAGDPSHEHEGKPVVAWHFLTDRGHFYYVALGDEAIMFDGDSHAEIARVALPLDA